MRTCTEPVPSVTLIAEPPASRLTWATLLPEPPPPSAADVLYGPREG